MLLSCEFLKHKSFFYSSNLIKYSLQLMSDESVMASDYSLQAMLSYHLADKFREVIFNNGK